MKRIILFAGILFPGYCLAQINIALSAGLAGFNMQEMKQHQLELKAQFPTDVKIIESFPAYWAYDLSVVGKISDRVNLGGTAGFTSTGGGMYYRDYSGFIDCNQLTTAKVLAGRIEVLLNPNTKWPIYVTGKTGVMVGRYDVDISVKVNNDLQSSHVELVSTNLFLEPGFMLSKPIVSILKANLSAGYNLNVYKGNLKLLDNKDLHLQNNAGEDIVLDWSGFRVGIGLSVDL